MQARNGEQKLRGFTRAFCALHETTPIGRRVDHPRHATLRVRLNMRSELPPFPFLLLLSSLVQ